MTAVLDLDVNDPELRHHAGRSYMIDWLKAHGADPMLCHRVEVLPDGDGTLRVHSFDPDYLTDAWPTAAPIGTDPRDIWGLEPVTVPMVAPVPIELRADIMRVRPIG